MKKLPVYIVITMFTAVLLLAQENTTDVKIVWLDELDVSLSNCGWQQTLKNKSVGGNALKLGGTIYERGIGTHAPGEFRVNLDGGTKRFTAMVGIDGESGSGGSSEFQVIGDDKLLWQSGVLRGGGEPKNVDIDLSGVKMLKLVVTTGGNDYGLDHTDWADAKFEVTGNKPSSVPIPGTRKPSDPPPDVVFPDVKGQDSIVGPKQEVLKEYWADQYELITRMDHNYRFPKEQALNIQALAQETDRRNPVKAGIRRLEALIGKLKSMPNAPALSGVESKLAEIKVKSAESNEKDMVLYMELREVTREAALANPLLKFDSILFVSRGVLNDHKGNKVEYDGDHFCDQYFGHNGRAGGGLFILENWKSADARVLDIVKGLKVPSGLNEGMLMSDGAFISPDLSWDGKTVVFAWSSGKKEKWDPDGRFNIFKVGVDGSGLTRLTNEGMFDDFDPCWLPDGRIVFMSTRRHGYGRCHGRPVPAFTMYSMKDDGNDLIAIDYHETNEFHPSVDNVGRLVYTRWDYVDRDHNGAHHMWHCYPDGRDPRSYHANYVLPLDTQTGDKWPSGIQMRPFAEFNCRAVPGSDKFVATAGPHHGQAFGSLVLIDINTPDDNKMSQVKRITPNSLFPESECSTRGWDNMTYGTAWPLDESFYLCNYKDSVCIIDEFGNRDLVCKTLNGLRPLDPIPLRPRKIPPVIPTATYEGERFTKDAPVATISIMNVYITDEYGSLPEGSQIKQLRVVQVIPKSTPNANNPRVGFGDQSLARISLGVVPVEEDGSVYFKAPIEKAVYFQLLDKNGMAVQSMRSVTYIHKGEHLTCLGCHENKQQAPQLKATPMAMRRPPSDLESEVKDFVMFNFHHNIRPILQEKCIKCHQEKEKAGPKSMEYNDLDKYVFYLGHGYHNPKHGGSRSTPGKFGALGSVMGRTLLNEDHQKFMEEGKFTKEDLRSIAMWLDMNSNEYSVYKNIVAQKEGQLVWPEFDVDPDNYTGMDRRLAESENVSKSSFKTAQNSAQ